MSSSNLEAIVFKAAEDILQVVSPNSEISVKNCEMWDSMKHILFVMELEKKLSRKIETDQINDMYSDLKTVIQVLSKTP